MAAGYNNFDFIEPGYIPDSYDFNFIYVPTSYFVLKGSSNNFTSVWVYVDKLYITNSDALSIIDLSDNSLHDWYTQTRAGRASEMLEHDGIIDLNVVEGS